MEDEQRHIEDEQRHIEDEQRDTEDEQRGATGGSCSCRSRAKAILAYGYEFGRPLYLGSTRYLWRLSIWVVPLDGMPSRRRSHKRSNCRADDVILSRRWRRRDSATEMAEDGVLLPRLQRTHWL